jgi:hypothetical protein
VLARLNPQSATVLILVAFIGLLFTLVGITFENRLVYNLFTALGGTFFGSALGLSFVRIFEPSQIGALLNVLAEANRSSLLRVDESRYAPFRTRMHGYLRSRDEKGAPVWRYRQFDFGASRTPGHLHAVVDVPRPDTKIRQFIYDGYICGDHLVLVGQPAIVGSEQHVVHVFPDATTIQHGTVCGFCFVDSFDNSRLLTPSILSEAPLTSQEKAGQVPSSEHFRLNDIWHSHIGQHRQLNFDPAAFRVVTP